MPTDSIANRRKGIGAMEVPAISNVGGGYAPSSDYSNVTAMQAGASASMNVTSGQDGSLSITMANQVNMVFSQVGQAGGSSDQTIKALIMLLLIQMMLKGGLDDQTKGMLGDLAQAFQSTGQSDMTTIAMQASSMTQIDIGGMGGDMPVMAMQSSAGVGLNVMA
jgi:hypothetical protein